MLINVEIYTLKTYSNDLICIQKGNDTLSSSFDIRTTLNYISRNGYEDIKNRVEDAMANFRRITISELINSFETKNYKINKDIKNEYEVSDKFHRNNTRWINKFNLLQKLYLLEINKLESQSIEELVADIKQLNDDFENIIKDLK
jgi:hypothetical protein